VILRTLLLWLLLVSSALAVGRGVVVIEDPEGGGQALYTGSHALLVGVSDYTGGWPDLESVPRELDQVQTALEGQGFHVVKRLNLDGQGLKDAFEGFINQYGYRPDNRLLFYFSGHGHTWEEASHGYLVPADAPWPATDTGDPGPEFLRRALHMSQILAWSRQMTAKHALFLFDSCFSGTVFKTKNLPKRPPHISRATTQKVRQFITAGSAGQQVPARSVFTPAFVDALDYRWGDLNKDGYITGMELGLYLQAKVPEHAQQSPQFGKHPDYHLSRGDFLFETGKGPEPPVASAAPAAPPPPPPVQFRGNVQVNVNVPATVYINGENVGEAAPGRPLNRQGVAAGQAEVRVATSGYTSATQSVQVRRGQWEQIVFELERAVDTARLTVRSNVYGDTVYIDGRRLGSTRLDVELAPGPHTVRVEKTGYVAHETRVELRAGRDALVRAHLTRVAAAVPPPAPAVPKAPPVAERNRQAALEAARQEACIRGCGAGLETCRGQRLASDPETCRTEVQDRCQKVYRACRSDGSVLIFGEVSADSECTGRQMACERERLAKCGRAAEQAGAGCERQAEACQVACRQ